MSATKEFLFKLEESELAADQASYALASELARLSNLIWRAGRVEGPSLDMPLAQTEQHWLDAMREQIQDALLSLEEIQAANESLKSLL